MHQKAAQKRQELIKRCQELAKQVDILRIEKASAVRLCEEKSAYDLRLTDFGRMAGIAPLLPGAALTASPPAALPATPWDHSQLRAIMERREREAERLRRGND